MPVELVFIHGWGFDARFWEPLARELPQFSQTHIDLGFFDADSPSLAEGLPHTSMSGKKPVLIGHSLGFIHGIRQRQDWGGLIAINSFPRFVKNGVHPGCVTAAALRAMRTRLAADPKTTLNDFYKLIAAAGVKGQPNPQRLCEGLDELRDGDVKAMLETQGTPGLVLASTTDPLVPLAASEALGHLAKQGGLKLHGGGHLLPLTDPGWCAREIADFVTTHFN